MGKNSLILGFDLITGICSGDNIKKIKALIKKGADIEIHDKAFQLIFTKFSLIYSFYGVLYKILPLTNAICN